MAGHFALFDTPIGQCAIAWTLNGVAGLQLPDADEASLRGAIVKRHPDFTESRPLPVALYTIGAVRSLLSGNPESMLDVQLDMEGIPPFHRDVYAQARRITPGSTCTYGELAQALGKPGAARAVGQALGANPFVLVVPCHRVLAAGGRLNGFSAHGGIETKRRLLDIEGGMPRTGDRLF